MREWKGQSYSISFNVQFLLRLLLSVASTESLTGLTRKLLKEDKKYAL